MFVSLDDFRIKAENFDLTKPENILRITCGVFYLPHIFLGSSLYSVCSTRQS